MEMEYVPGREVESDDWDRDTVMDAFHCPAVLAVADQELQPGQKVKLSLDLRCATSGKGDDYEAICDPFLTEPVTEGEKFWAFVRPGMVTGVRHHFELKHDSSKSEYCGSLCG